MTPAPPPHATPRRPARAGALLALALAGGACAPLDVHQRGVVDPGVQVLPGGVPCSFDALGRLSIDGALVELPRAAERERWGVVAVDLAPLGAWAPTHVLAGAVAPGGAPPAGGQGVARPDSATATGRVVLAALDRASPLALAGARPFDLVVAVDGAPVRAPADLVDPLAASAPGRALVVDLVRASGEPARLEVEPGPPLGLAGGFRAPFLAETRSAATGSAWALGPLDALAFRRTVVEHRLVPPPRPKQPAPDEAAPAPPPPADRPSRSYYVRRSDWGALLGLVRWESEQRWPEGPSVSRLWLLWVIPLGDDLDADVGPVGP